MESFLHAVASVTIILLLTATGYFCAAMGWMSPQAKRFISKFTMSVAIPCMCVYGLTNNLTHELLAGSLGFLLVPLLSTVGAFLLSLLVGRLLKLPRKRLGVFMMMCSVSNAIFIGLPMCTELFGEACTPYVMLYYLVNTSFVQLVGLSLVRWAGDGGGFDCRMIKKFLTTPAVIGVLVSFVLVFTGVSLPPLVMSYCKYMNNLVTPLALLLTGYIIYEIGLKNLKLDRDLAIMLLFRFLLVPGVSFALCELFGVAGLGRSVLLVETAMPVVTQTVVAAADYGADEQ
jgi:predicted permease